MKCSGEEMEKHFQYEFEYWKGHSGFEPIECLRSEDYSESYEMTMAHLFKLEGEKYAVVTEEGCSCYLASDANIEIFPSLKKAEDKFDEWDKENNPARRAIL